MLAGFGQLILELFAIGPRVRHPPKRYGLDQAETSPDSKPSAITTKVSPKNSTSKKTSKSVALPDSTTRDTSTESGGFRVRWWQSEAS